MATKTKRSGRVSIRYHSVITKNPDTTTESKPVLSLAWSDTHTGFPNPAWRQLVAQHRNAGTPSSGSRFKVTGSDYGYKECVLTRISPSASHDEVRRSIQGNFLDAEITLLTPYVNASLKDQVMNQALNRFYKRLWSALRSMQGGVFIGEVREALSLIRSPGKALRKGIDTYVKDARKRLHRIRPNPLTSRFADSPGVRRTLSDTWLEHNFGWAPLISDVKSGAEAIAKLASYPFDFENVRAGDEGSEDLITSAQDTVSKVYDGTLRVWIQTPKYFGKIQCRYLGQVRIAIDNPVQMGADLLGFTWNDFLPTVWELIPYSFLCDYFTNIGDVISAWSFPRGNINWHNRSVRHSATKVICVKNRPTPNPNSAWWKITSDSGPDLMVQLERSSFVRDQDPLGFPSVAFEIPGSGLKWLNIAALAGSRRL